MVSSDHDDNVPYVCGQQVQVGALGDMERLDAAGTSHSCRPVCAV